MTDEKFKGHLDRLRENVDVLDEAIANARRLSKSKKKGDNPLQWTKTLRLRTRGRLKMTSNKRERSAILGAVRNMFKAMATLPVEEQIESLGKSITEASGWPSTPDRDWIRDLYF